MKQNLNLRGPSILIGPMQSSQTSVEESEARVRHEVAEHGGLACASRLLGDWERQGKRTAQ